MAEWHRRSPDGALLLRVHVQPGARRSEVCGLHGEALKVRIAAAAVDGRANEALLCFIAQRLGVPRRDVELVSGERSREKRLRVSGFAGDAAVLLEG